MSVDAVKRYFKESGLDYPILEFDGSSATVEEAARLLGVENALIAKTLAFRLKDRDVLVIAKGDARIDNRKFKEFFTCKAKMLDPGEVEEITGHPVGGVCPFGLKNPLDIYMDVSLKGFEYVYPAAGSRNSAVKISPPALQELTGAQWVDVCQ